MLKSNDGLGQALYMKRIDEVKDYTLTRGGLMDVKAVIGRISGPGGDGWKKICHEKSAMEAVEKHIHTDRCTAPTACPTKTCIQVGKESERILVHSS